MSLNKTRPSVDLEKVRASLSSAVVSDVLDSLGYRNQCLASGLRPVDPALKLVGYAAPVSLVRVHGIPKRPFEGLVAALDAIGEDEIFVTPTGRAVDIAVWGELLSTACVAHGAAGALTDGMIRDTDAIRNLGFPVISAGTIPYDSLGRHEIVGQVDLAVIDGVAFERGDLIVGDVDGVVILPRQLVDEVIESALAKRVTELKFRRDVATGMLASKAFAKYGVL